MEGNSSQDRRDGSELETELDSTEELRIPESPLPPLETMSLIDDASVSGDQFVGTPEFDLRAVTQPT
jgi:hypothetical protein